ncbi:MAG: copper homeostasis protein CutC [Dysgonomonas sp.]|nr:copper homeostasis protein CutC [Dysgonomonas sp.]
MVLVEVASNSVQSAIEAEKGGAKRIELCGNLMEGGTTPAKSQIELTREHVSIDLNVIIRPRGGDFMYDDLDFESMKRDIQLCGELKCDGVVIGILDPDGNIDLKRNLELVELAKKYNLSVTFHRAFDRVKSLSDALEDVIKLGCDRILTSGGYANVYDGRFVIKDLVEQAGDRIIIMPGAGVKEENAAEIISFTGAKEIHGTFQSLFQGKMNFHSPNFTDNSEYSYLLSDSKRVSEIVKKVN